MKKYLSKILVLALIFVLFLFSGCRINPDSSPKHNDNTIVLYDADAQHFIIYNTTKKLGNLENAGTNLFQYEFPEKTNIYTTGDSIKNNFKIVKIISGKIKVLYKVNKNQALIPLTTNGSRYYFVHAFYDSKGKEISNTRRIALFNFHKKTLSDFPKSSGLISKGTLIDNELYYTIYNKSKDNYELFKVNTSKVSNIPRFLKSGLRDPEILSNHLGLWINNGKKIYNGNKIFFAKDYNYIHNDFLIQLKVSQDATKQILITNVKNNKILYKENNCLDFKFIKKSTLIIYGENYIKRLSI